MVGRVISGGCKGDIRWTEGVYPVVGRVISGDWKDDILWLEA